MFYQEFLPAAPLRPFIKSYAVLEDRRSDENGIEELVPPLLTKAIIFFYEMDRIHISNGIFDGVLPTGYISPQGVNCNLWSYKRKFGSFAIIFNPGKFRYFFEMPLLEFLGTPIPLEDFGEQDLQELHEKIMEAETVQDRIEASDACLLARLTYVKRKRNLIDEALKDLFVYPKVTLTGLVSKFDISERHFRRKFQNEIGIGFKQYHRQIRFLRALYVLESRQFRTLSEVAQKCGYYDHSQFVKEFKSYLKLSPSEYLAFRFPITESIHWLE